MKSTGSTFNLPLGHNSSIETRIYTYVYIYIYVRVYISHHGNCTRQLRFGDEPEHSTQAVFIEVWPTFWPKFWTENLTEVMTVKFEATPRTPDNTPKDPPGHPQGRPKDPRSAGKCSQTVHPSTKSRCGVPSRPFDFATPPTLGFLGFLGAPWGFLGDPRRALGCGSGGHLGPLGRPGLGW